VLIGFLPPDAEVQLLDNVIALSAAGSQFSADYGTVRGQTEEQQRQARIMTDRWREHGLDLHIPDLTYPGEHTDVAAHLQVRGWDTATSTLGDLFDAAGLAPLEPEAQAGASASVGFVRATRG
jgi:O-methyltransferase involved in polyketide biosynthesis